MWTDLVKVTQSVHASCAKDKLSPERLIANHLVEIATDITSLSVGQVGTCASKACHTLKGMCFYLKGRQNLQPKGEKETSKLVLHVRLCFSSPCRLAAIDLYTNQAIFCYSLGDKKRERVMGSDYCCRIYFWILGRHSVTTNIGKKGCIWPRGRLLTKMPMLFGNLLF